MYKVVLTQRALRDLKRLNRLAKKEILNKLAEYSKEPLEYARKLVNPKIGTYRFRIGDYRAIFDIEGKDIVILRIGHRKDIYK